MKGSRHRLGSKKEYDKGYQGIDWTKPTRCALCGDDVDETNLMTGCCKEVMFENVCPGCDEIISECKCGGEDNG